MARKREPLLLGVRAWMWIGTLLLAALSVCLVVSLSSSSQPTIYSAIPSGQQGKPPPPTPTRPGVAEFMSLDYVGGGEVEINSSIHPENISELDPKLAFSNPADPETTVPQLIKCLQHPSAAIRGAAALRLGTFRHEAGNAVPMLKQLLQDDPDEIVRERARDALYNIRGYDFGPRTF